MQPELPISQRHQARDSISPGAEGTWADPRVSQQSVPGVVDAGQVSDPMAAPHCMAVPMAEPCSTAVPVATPRSPPMPLDRPAVAMPPDQPASEDIIAGPLASEDIATHLFLLIPPLSVSAAPRGPPVPSVSVAPHEPPVLSVSVAPREPPVPSVSSVPVSGAVSSVSAPVSVSVPLDPVLHSPLVSAPVSVSVPMVSALHSPMSAPVSVPALFPVLVPYSVSRVSCPVPV
ncbi:proline-rich protein 36-like [Pygocentrus nattereri]|uniref:proline-rich protein 36-like n=1 Tax=Pygocentrus nattereri TaxID=42514 RepID=UPI001890D709|nr:proline-rich protein 36-like [Pygocentrus nattereri]